MEIKPMTKNELLNLVNSKVENLTKKQTGAVVDAVFAALSEAIVTGARFSYPGFGTFTVRDRAAREGRNPRTGETIQIAAAKNVNFKAAPKLKAALNGEKKADAKKADAKKAPAKKAAKKGKK